MLLENRDDVVERILKHSNTATTPSALPKTRRHRWCCTPHHNKHRNTCPNMELQMCHWSNCSLSHEHMLDKCCLLCATFWDRLLSFDYLLAYSGARRRPKPTSLAPLDKQALAEIYATIAYLYSLNRTPTSPYVLRLLDNHSSTFVHLSGSAFRRRLVLKR